MLKKIPDKEYFALDAISQSDLAMFSENTPKEYLHRKLTGITETPAMLFGTLVHAMVLEPEALLDRYAVFEFPEDKKTKNYKKTKVYKEAKAQFDTENDSKKIIDMEVWQEAKAMALAIRKDTNCQILTRSNLIKEHAILGHKFEDQDVKGKLDALDDEKKIIIDLKTTTQAFDDQAFSRYASSTSFLIQSAFYLDLIAAERGQDYTFVFCCVQTKAPYLSRKIVVSEKASPEYVEEGRRLYKEAMHGMMQCKTVNNWPGYEGKNFIAQLPRWYKGAN